MRFLIGLLATIIVLTGATLTVLALWGIHPISWTIVWKLGVTMIIICGTSLLVYLFYYLFFRKYTHNKSQGNRAHPLN